MAIEWAHLSERKMIVTKNKFTTITLCSRAPIQNSFTTVTASEHDFSCTKICSFTWIQPEVLNCMPLIKTVHAQRDEIPWMESLKLVQNAKTCQQLPTGWHIFLPQFEIGPTISKVPFFLLFYTHRDWLTFENQFNFDQIRQNPIAIINRIAMCIRKFLHNRYASAFSMLHAIVGFREF